MSWNGATEVQFWRVYSTAPGESREAILLATTETSGFETHVDAGRLVMEGFVEAFGGQGELLGRSDISPVSQPPESLAHVCGEEHCMLQVLQAEQKVAEGELRNATCAVTTSDVAVQWLGLLLQALVLFALGIFAGKSDLLRIPFSRAILGAVN